MKKIIFYIGVSTLALSFASFAAMPQASMVGAVPGAYVGLNVGMGGMDVNKSFPHDATGRTYLGYLWNISSVSGLKLGTELGFVYLHDEDVRKQEQKWTYNRRDIDLLGVAHYNLVDSKFFLLGKGGIAFAHQMIEMTGYGYTDNKAKTKVLPTIAAGVGYDVTRHFEINLLASHTFGKSADKFYYGETSVGNNRNVVSINTLTLGITGHFG